MHLLFLRLQARSPERNTSRAYSLWLGQDLFGNWVIQVIYGRIGSKGITKVYVFPSREEVYQRLKLILRRRASSQKRLGCSYKLVEYQADSCLEDIDLEPFNLRDP